MARPEPRQQHQFTADDRRNFQVLGIEPDPNKQYTLQEIEAAKMREFNRLKDRFPREADQQQERSRIESAASSLINKFTKEKQKQAHKEGKTLAEQQYERAKEQHNKEGRRDYMGITNMGASYFSFLMIDLMLQSGQQLFPAFNGPKFTPELDQDRLPDVTDADENRAEQIVNDYAEEAGIRIQRDQQDPRRIAGFTVNPNPTPAEHRAREQMGREAQGLHRDVSQRQQHQQHQTP